MVCQAKKLQKQGGYGAEVEKKKGRPVSDSTIEKVKNFYLLDESSRMMPGIQDYISTVIDGKRCQIQKRLMLHNINNLHSQFKIKYPDVQISLASFRKLKTSSVHFIWKKWYS